MRAQYGVWLGMGGAPPGDNARAREWERRLHWTMIWISLLSVPAFFLDTLSHGPLLQRVALGLDLVILVVFAAELLWMLWLSSRRWLYFWRNWLHVLIILGAGASLYGHSFEWIAATRVLRIALVGMLLLRALGALRFLFTPRGIPFLLGFCVAALGVAGAGFYWLEPSIDSFWDGLWLAFVTGTTVGYGDLIPTTLGARLFAVFIVILGFSMMSLLTAGIVSFFIGQEETELRQEMHRDIRALRGEVQELISEEEKSLHREMHRDLKALRDEITGLRADLDNLRRGDGDGSPPAESASRRPDKSR